MAELTEEGKKVLCFHGSDLILKMNEEKKIATEEMPSLFRSVRKDCKDDWLSVDSKRNVCSIIASNSEMFLQSRDPPRKPMPESELNKLFGDLPCLTAFMMPSADARRTLFLSTTEGMGTYVFITTHISPNNGVILLDLLCVESQRDLRVDDLSIACVMFSLEKPHEEIEIGSYVRATIIAFYELENCYEISCNAMHLPDSLRNLAHLGVISSDEIASNVKIWQKPIDDWSKLMTKSVDNPGLLREQMEALGIDQFGSDSFVPALKNVTAGETLEEIRRRKDAEIKRKIEYYVNQKELLPALALAETLLSERRGDYVVVKGLVHAHLDEFDEAIECLNNVDRKNTLWVQHGKNALLQCYWENFERYKRSGELGQAIGCVISSHKLRQTDESLFQIFKVILGFMQQRSFFNVLDFNVEFENPNNEAVISSEDLGDKPSTSGMQNMPRISSEDLRDKPSTSGMQNMPRISSEDLRDEPSTSGMQNMTRISSDDVRGGPSTSGMQKKKRRERNKKRR